MKKSNSSCSSERTFSNYELFLAEVKKHPALKPSETEVLVKRIAAGDTSAQDELINGCYRLVICRALYYAQYLDDEWGVFDDLISEGLLALAQAARSIDPEKAEKCNFYPYAKKCIDGCIMSSLECNGRSVKIPYDVRKEYNRALKIESDLRMGIDVSDADLDWYDEEGNTVLCNLCGIATVSSLDTPICFGDDEDDRGCLADLVVSPYGAADELVNKRDLSVIQQQRMRLLNDNQRTLACYYLGLDGHEMHRVDVIADIMGVSETRVRQLYNEILEILPA